MTMSGASTLSLSTVTLGTFTAAQSGGVGYFTGTTFGLTENTVVSTNTVATNAHGGQFYVSGTSSTYLI